MASAIENTANMRFQVRELQFLARAEYRAKLRRTMVDLSKDEDTKPRQTMVLIEKDEAVALVSDAEDDCPVLEDTDDDDDISNDPEIREMWERGEHTCLIYDAPCMVCEKDKGEEDEEDDVRFLTEEEDELPEVRFLTKERLEMIPKWLLNHVAE